jgi:gamma-glutamyl hercynylcysteine S-oxide hydrolase
VHDLVLAPPNGLLVQSYAPRRQQYGLMNADGWGVGFWHDGRPARWRSVRPLWQDAGLASVSPALRSGCVVAAVRSATEGMPIEEAATAPFLHDGWLVSHNGRVDRAVLPGGDRSVGDLPGGARSVGDLPGGDLPVRPQPAESLCDAAVLAAHVVAAGVHRLARTVAEIGAADPRARLNLLLGNGSRLLATTWGDTLSILRTPSGTVLASEPYDEDPGWSDVPDRRLVEVTRTAVTVTLLEERP